METLLEIFALESLHHDVGDAVLRPVVVRMDHVGRAETRRRAGILFEAHAVFAIRRVRVAHELDGDDPTELFVLGFPDRRQPPASDSLAELVATRDQLPRSEKART